MSTLLIVDLQKDFLPGGALAVPQGEQVIPVANRLIPSYEHVVATQDWHPAGHSSFASTHEAEPMSMMQMPYGPQVLWPDHCIQGSTGAQFHPDLTVDRADLIIRKGFNPEIDSYSAFFENDHTTPTGLEGYLRTRGIDRLTLVGLATDFCVNYSAVDAAKLGFRVTVIESLCRAIDFDGSLDAARAQMRNAGVVLDITVLAFGGIRPIACQPSARRQLGPKMIFDPDVAKTKRYPR